MIFVRSSGRAILSGWPSPECECSATAKMGWLSRVLRPISSATWRVTPFLQTISIDRGGWRPLALCRTRKEPSPRPQQCCKIVPDSRLCHFQNAAPTEVRARMAAPTRSPSKAG